MERSDTSKTTARTRLFQEDQRRFYINLCDVIFVVYVSGIWSLLCCALQYAEDIESGSSDVEAKYKKMYEDDINPFAAFSKKVDICFNILLIIFFMYCIA
jgi:hypothetical protein